MKDSQRFIAIINTAIRYCKWLIVILVALICCSGIRVVNNHEVAVVLRFGRLVGDTREEQVKEPGLLLAFPYVIDEVIKVPVGRCMRCPSPLTPPPLTPPMRRSRTPAM